MSNKLNNKWLKFYESIKGQDWPKVSTEDDIQNLPKHILQEIIFTFLEPNINKGLQKLSDLNFREIKNSQYYQENPVLDNTSELTINDIKIFYHPDLDGGGTGYGRRYPRVIKEIYGDKIFKNCFEWCSGPGFIGFELLSENICDNLFLADIYQPALTAINKTVMNLPTKYQNKVHSAQIKGIADLPADWKFDLVVANPPHWNHNMGAFITNVRFRDRICQDQDWDLHREFFNHIAPYLNENAVILLQEQSYASGPDMFRSMIEQAGLKVKNCYFEDNHINTYYLEVEK
jgi:16S rRNA G966 N2-methylase RsmD